MAIDKMLQSEIIGIVERSMKKSMEQYNERWVDATELRKQIGCITKGWLRSYGHTLPREQVVVTDSKGSHRTGWCYPLHRILRMMDAGDLTKLKA